MFKNFNELLESFDEGKTPSRCAVAAAADEHTLAAVIAAADRKIIEPVLVGDTQRIKAILLNLGEDPDRFEIVDCESGADCAQAACDVIAQGEASCIMKGMLDTADIMRAILKKENGLRGDGFLSAVSILEIPGYHKLLCTTDPGLNLYPDVDEKEKIINNAVKLMRGLGIEKPKVAVLAAVEKVNPKMQATVDAAELRQRNIDGRIPNCYVDGPLSYDIAISRQAAETKKIMSDVAGDPDIIVYPNIDVGNIAGKALVYTAKAKSAAIMTGARIPIINTSRSLSVDGKLRAIALAAVCGVTD